MRLLVWIIAVHGLLYLGLGRGQDLAARLRDYPAHFIWMAESGALMELLEPSGLTLLYLSLGVAASWALLPALRGVNRRALEVVSSLPAFALVLFAVFITFQIGRSLELGVWLEPLHPWTLGVLTLALALPVAARAALMEDRRQALETAVLDRAARPQRLPGSMAQVVREALGMAASLMLIEGVLQFPGLGRAAFAAFEIASGLGGDSDLESRAVIARSSAALLLLLLLAGAHGSAGRWLAARFGTRVEARRRA